MSSVETRPRAVLVSPPTDGAPGGAATPHPTNEESTPIPQASGGAPTSRQAMVDTTPSVPPPAGSQLAGRQWRYDTHLGGAASDLPTDRQVPIDAQRGHAVGFEAGQDPAASVPPMPVRGTLLAPALALAADVLDDLERVRIANENRLRQLTRSAEDSDGEVRGFGLDESHPDVARLAAMVDMLRKVEHDATLNLQRHMRKHPIGPWAKSIRGAGDKQVARLLAAIGDPYIRPEIVREDGTVLPTGPRTVSALWAYCGLHVLPASGHSVLDALTGGAAGRAQLPADRCRADTQKSCVGGSGGDPGQGGTATHMTHAGVAPKRARGQKANWSTGGKTKAYLIALSCLKQLVKPCHNPADGPAVHVDDCQCSPYRVVYDRRRAHTAVTRPDWTDGHSHNDALRVTAKAFLRDLWREAKRIHESTAEEATS
jgi:hypothetical protein